jgi:hypothetical protein
MVALLLAAAALHIEAQPARLELGKSSLRAVVRIASKAEPRLSVNVGGLVKLRRDGPESWTAEYVPPRETFPQVAILAAVVDGEVAWTSLPLWGSGVAMVQTRAKARISVEIGGRTFGPAQADEHGQALVPVIVPPGVHEVRHRGRRIPLPVPDASRLHVVLLGERAQADRAERVTVCVLAIDDEGKPRSGAKLTMQADRGDLSAPRERAPGELWTTWTVPPGSAGAVKLRVALSDAPALIVQAQLALAPGPPAAIELSADRESIVAGAGVDVVLRARARDATGNVSLDPLEISTPEGFGGPVEARPGEWRLRPPDSFGGRQSLEVIAHPRGRAEPHASTWLRLLPGQPASASIEPGSPAVRIGPSGRLQLRVLQTDRFGNLVPGQAPAASAQEGSIAAVERQPDGAYLATYLPPRSWDREDTVVDVRWPEASARTRVLLLPRLATLAISPKAGVVSNFAKLTSPVAALEASLRTDRFGPELAFSTELAWYFSSTQQDAGQLGTAQGRVDFFALSTQLAFRFPIGIRTTVWAGAGPSFEALASKVKVGAEPQVSESTIVVGAAASIGVERRFASTVPFAELRWSRHRDPSLSTLTGAISATSLVLGTRFELL